MPASPYLRRQQILKGKVDFGGSSWVGISDEAKDFVRALLHKDAAKRPTALEALHHPFLAKKTSYERSSGSSLGMKVLKRIQVSSQIVCLLLSTPTQNLM